MIFEYKHLFTTEFRTFKFSISEMDGLITEVLSKKNASFQRGIAKALLISIFLQDDYLTVLILI